MIYYILPMATIGLTLKGLNFYNPGYFLIFTLITASMYGAAKRRNQQGRIC